MARESADLVQAIALLNLVIDLACTVVFEALPATPGLMQRPPRPAGTPLFGPNTWRRALGQRLVLTLALLLLAFWPCPDCRWCSASLHCPLLVADRLTRCLTPLQTIP